MRSSAAGCLIALVILLSSCDTGPEQGRLTDQGRTVVPRGNGGNIILAAETDGALSSGPEGFGPELKVRLPAEYIPSQAVTVNLDLDESEEQIIVFKRRDDPDDLIRLLVVAFDPIRNSWIRAWEGVTAATSVRSFSVYTDDLIGDHEQEIVAFGINTNGEQTLDVFRKTSDALGLGLSYAPILSVAADVTIDIDKVARPDSYEAMDTVTIPSYTVLAERRDRTSANPFDSIRTTYFWDFSARRYVPGRVESVSGEAIADGRLRDLFAGNEHDFERFLSGPWYRSSDTETTQLAFFGHRDRTIVFHNGHLQQAYLWDNSTKAVYGRGVSLFITNESIRTVKRLVSVSVQDLNRITIAIQGTNGLDGTYERLTGSLQTAVLRTEARMRLSETELSGLYRSDAGIEIVFRNPEFTFRDGGLRSSGGYALYGLGADLILAMKHVDENRLPQEQLTYRATFRETRGDDRIVRRLRLERGEIGIAGFFDTGHPEITLEQIVMIDNGRSSQ
jgi:hypothetical protein